MKKLTQYFFLLSVWFILFLFLEHTYITPSNLSSGMTYPTGEREIGEGKHHSDDSNQSEEQDEKF